MEDMKNNFIEILSNGNQFRFTEKRVRKSPQMMSVVSQPKGDSFSFDLQFLELETRVAAALRDLKGLNSCIGHKESMNGWLVTHEKCDKFD